MWVRNTPESPIGNPGSAKSTPSAPCLNAPASNAMSIETLNPGQDLHRRGGFPAGVEPAVGELEVAEVDESQVAVVERGVEVVEMKAAGGIGDQCRVDRQRLEPGWPRGEQRELRVGAHHRLSADDVDVDRALDAEAVDRDDVWEVVTDLREQRRLVDVGVVAGVVEPAGRGRRSGGPVDRGPHSRQ